MGDQRRDIPVVFISSTSEDLKPHRERVRDAAIMAGFHPVMMEYFTASGARPPLEECLAKVSAADLVVVLVAHRYGWVPADQPDGGKKSITWLECERAIADKKEVLAFVVDTTQSWPEEQREEYEITKAVRAGNATPELLATVQRNVKLLSDFKVWLDSSGIRAKFTTPDDIFGKVSAALPDWSKRHRTARTSAASTPATRRDPSPYLRWLYERNATISIRGLQVGTGKAHRFPIDDLFIPLSTMLAAEPRGGKAGRKQRRAPGAEIGKAELARGRVRLEEALQHDRLVIVGDPGSGKSTFLRRIAFVLSRALLGEGTEIDPSSLGLPGSPFPILIELARLAEHMASSVIHSDSSRPTTTSSPAWLRHYLSAAADEFSWGLDDAHFREGLESGSCIVLLDGLDEAPSRTSRENLSALIEETAGTFTRCRFVVTGRPAAFAGRAALPGFTQVQIEPLEDAAIETFLSRWCEALYPESPALAKQHRAALSEALRVRPEIRRMARNPVMLTASRSYTGTSGGSPSSAPTSTSRL